MAQRSIWEKEYRDPQLLTKKAEPQADLKKYLHTLKKEFGVLPGGLRVLDLGSGTGRNANYLASLGAVVTGIEIAPSALALARERARALGVRVNYLEHDMGTPYPFEGGAFDVILDIMSSNSLNEKERSIYLAQTRRVLKPGGDFFVKTLCKDGDKNAKQLLKISPGSEPDTYVNKDMGLTERVFAQADFAEMYGRFFTIDTIVKKTNYTRFRGQPYRRNFLLAYMRG